MSGLVGGKRERERWKGKKGEEEKKEGVGGAGRGGRKEGGKTYLSAGY